MNQENNKFNDDIDKLLYEHFKKDIDLPPSTIYTIEHAFTKNKKKTNIQDKIKKFISILVAFVLLSSGVVFAKELIAYIQTFFSNSTEGIESAANNGYIQEVNSSFVECNNLSIKIDNIILDDNILDISFIYKYTDDVDSINISDVLIKDTDDNILYYISDDYNNDYQNYQIGNSLIRTHNTQNLENGFFNESLLITSQDNTFPKSSGLTITINKAYIEQNGVITTLEGLWEFNIDLSNKFQERENYYYIISNNEYLVNYEAILTDTSFDIYLYFDIELEINTIVDDNNLILWDNNGNSYIYKNISTNNFPNNSNYKSKIELHFDNINKYTDISSIKQLQLVIKLNSNKNCTYNLIV